MEAMQLCPVCQGPIPANAAQERLIDCLRCGTTLVRTTDGCVQLGSSSD